MKQGRLGFTESTLLFCNYLRNKNIEEVNTIEFIKYEASFIQWLFNTSGFFDLSFDYTYNYIHSPVYQKLMNEFFQMSKQSTFTRFAIHDSTFSKYLPDFYKNFNVVEYSFDKTLNEFYSFIRDRNVLIINPMSKLMKSQYDSGNLFNINNFPRVNSIQYYINDYTFFNKCAQLNKDITSKQNSFEHVETIINDINCLNYDCVIISCGAISSFIANRIDKDYLIIGSNLLTFFGIKHDRIKDNYESKYNEYWVDVPDECKPSDYKMVENGCYW
jgi:hypothetical protein